MVAGPDLAARVIAVFADNKRLEPGRITAATTFAELNMDSLDALNIAFALEEAFHISIPDEQLRSLRTVGDAIEGVRKLLADGKSAAAQRAS